MSLQSGNGANFSSDEEISELHEEVKFYAQENNALVEVNRTLESQVQKLNIEVTFFFFFSKLLDCLVMQLLLD